MKTIININLLLALIFFSYCKTEDKKGIDEKIFVDPMHEVSLDISKSLGEARIVPLETSKESLIICPDKVIEIDENFYILDKQQDAIVLFDKKGRFIKKLIAVGKPGPNELASIRDISVNNYDRTLTAIGMFYIAKLSFDLKVVDKWDQRIGIGHMCWQSTNDAIYYSNYYNPNNETLLGRIEYKNEKVGPQILGVTNNIRLPYSQRSVFEQFDNDTIICIPLNDTIFHLKDGKLETYKIIDYGRFSLPLKYYKNLNHISYMEIIKKRYCFHHIRYFENTNHFIFSYSYAGQYHDYMRFKHNDSPSGLKSQSILLF